jgi:hypothetical protein
MKSSANERQISIPFKLSYSPPRLNDSSNWLRFEVTQSPHVLEVEVEVDGKLIYRRDLGTGEV